MIRNHRWITSVGQWAALRNAVAPIVTRSGDRRSAVGPAGQRRRNGYGRTHG